MTRDRAMLVSLFLVLLSCVTCRAEDAPATATTATATRPARTDATSYARERSAMVKLQLAGRDITNLRVLEAMERVPRERFVLKGWEAQAYEDRALPIHEGQTISQPYIVALMTQLADPKPGDRVLDIGTGSGYQAAVLAEMGADVASIEIIPALAEEAKQRLAEMKYDKVEVRAGDGYRGWPEKAPFAAIILAAAAPKVPQPLLDQLAPGGRLVIPVDDPASGFQHLLLVTRQRDGRFDRKKIVPVAFVPMTGEVRKIANP